MDKGLFLKKYLIGLPDDKTQDAKLITNKVSWRTISWKALDWLAMLHTLGDVKYYPGNWQLGKPLDSIKIYTDAMIRHAKEHMKGELIDADTGIPHVVQVMWNAEVVTHMLIEAGLLEELSPELAYAMIERIKQKYGK